MSGVSFFNDDSNPASRTTEMTVIITTTRLLDLLNDVLRALALSGSRRLSITIDASASVLPEGISILSVLRLLRAEFRMQRVHLINIHSRLRSTVVDVSAFVQGEHVVQLERIDLRYDVDDMAPPN